MTDIHLRKDNDSMLYRKVSIINNPWPHTVPDGALLAILDLIACERARDIETRHAQGEYSKASFGMVIMDPTAPLYVPSPEAVLALMVIGDEGEEKLVNAAAKGFDTRDYGVEAGLLLKGGRSYVLPDGAFRFGHAAIVDGFIGGGSALTELQDRYQTTLALAELVLRLEENRIMWAEDLPDDQKKISRWFCNQNLPGVNYSNVYKLRQQAWETHDSDGVMSSSLS